LKRSFNGGVFFVCGIAGFYSKLKINNHSASVLSKMGNAIVSRGPDSSGCWLDTSVGIGLVHQRLSIVDLSEAGHQPMISNCQRYKLVFNGEIYNHLDIRAELELISPQSWRGHSDTETLLAAIVYWGLKATLQKAIGMFALALWDSVENKLHLARDRFGEKPLYYGISDGVLLFGSQLKAMRQHPAFNAEIDRNSITLLFRHNYIPTPYSIYKDFFKLKPGSVYTFDSDLNVTCDEYWSARQVMIDAQAQPLTSPIESQVSILEDTLKLAVARQMLADVPLGAFLSGGVDSSLIVALMQAQSKTPVKTFSIGFTDKRFNEATFAKEVAQHLGTEHSDLYVTDEDVLAVIPLLAEMYDEPFSDSSQIPTYLVSKIARQHVTVSLSGDAGDELFCGYSRYMVTSKTWQKLRRFPLSIRKLMASTITLIPVQAWSALGVFLPKRFKTVNIGDKLHKAAGVLTSNSIDELYLKLISHWQDPESVVLHSSEPLTALTDPSRRTDFNDSINQMMALDTLSYLQDDILVKVDRAAMEVSLETRVPFLDHHVFELAWKLPLATKLREGQSKWCLRQILYKYVPKNLIERPKMGFAVPLDSWLRGPLREWGEQLLCEEKLIQQGFFNVKLVRKMWHEHLSCKRNWQYQLWDVLIFQAWYEKNHC
jgi:asparagine synthase (glutamine-hydrolysing)